MRRITGVLLAVAMAVAACSDSTGPRTGPPTSLARVSGHAQQGTVGATLANDLVVRVTDSEGNPVSGTSVNWSVTTGGGSVAPAESSTDEEGEARATWTLGTSTGAQSVTATVAELAPVVFEANALAGPFTSLTGVSGTGQTAPSGCPVPEQLVVRAADEFGNPLAGIEVAWAATAGAVDPETSETDEAGEAFANWLLGPAEGPQTATAVAGGATVEFAGTGTEPPAERSGALSVDYEGDDTGTFETDGDFRICPGGLVTATEWAFTYFDTEDDVHFLLASSSRGNGRSDLILIFLEDEVTAPGEITWDFNACEAGFEEACVADGLLALDFPADGSIDDAEFIYFFDTGTIEFTTVTADRLVGVFEAEGFTYDGSDRELSATDGAFDLPLIPEADLFGAPAAGAPAVPGLEGAAAEAVRRLMERLPRRQ